MEKYIKSNNSSSMSKIEAFFQRRLLAQKNLYAIKLNSIDLNSKNKTINFKKMLSNSKKSIENSKINSINNNYNYTTQSTERTVPQLLKMNENYPKRILSYRERNNNKLKYNKAEIKKDLRKYTNNSTTFKYFSQLNKEYHPYTVNKAIRSILLASKEKETETHQKIIQLKAIKSLLYNNSKIYTNEITPKHNYINKKLLFRNNYNNNNLSNSKNNTYTKTTTPIKTYLSKKSKTFKKRFSKFINISSIKKPNKTHYFSNKKKDIELMDEVDIHIFENDKLNLMIKNSLLNDINHDEINYKLFLDYLKSLTNKIDFHEDIYLVPHIQNNLSLAKPFDNLVLLNEKLRDKNLLHKQVALSMNKISIIKILLMNKREIEMKKYMEKNDFKPKRKWSNNDESLEKKIGNQYEKKFQHFELTDYFGKCNNYNIIGFANQKLKECIFYKKFTKE